MNFTLENVQILNYSMVDLVFDGLDTQADVYLNNNLILQANNMFRRWIVNNVSHWLNPT